MPTHARHALVLARVLLGVVVHTFHPSRADLVYTGAPGQPRLHSESLTQRTEKWEEERDLCGYPVTLCVTTVWLPQLCAVSDVTVWAGSEWLM